MGSDLEPFCQQLLVQQEAVLLGLFRTGVSFFENDTRERKGHVTLMPHKLYLDSCVSYHTMFDAFWLENVHKVDTIMAEHCNAGVTTTDTLGEMFGLFEVWLNENEIENLLSSPQLKEDDYRIKTSHLRSRVSFSTKFTPVRNRPSETASCWTRSCWKNGSRSDPRKYKVRNDPRTDRRDPVEYGTRDDPRTKGHPQRELWCKLVR